MNHDDFLAGVYAQFHPTAFWPFVRTMQKLVGKKQTGIRTVTAEIGRKFVFCEEKQEDSRCILTESGLARVPAAKEDLDVLARALGYMGDMYDERGAQPPVTSNEIAEALSLDKLQLGRLGQIRLVCTFPSSGGSSSPTEPSAFTIGLVEDISRFAGVATYEEARVVSQQLEAERERVHELTSADSTINRRRVREGSQAITLAPQTTRYIPLDAGLRALLDRDLQELEVVRSAGAWKSTALLAGSCLEAVLLDLMLKHPDEAQRTFGSADWPTKVNASQLLDAAERLGLISKDHKEMGSAVRRWRNIIHPANARAATGASERLAEALYACVQLLLSDLSSSSEGA